jgi:hypothetical protein
MSGLISPLAALLATGTFPAGWSSVRNAEFGVGTFGDYPILPYGSPGYDSAYTHLVDITDSASDVAAGFASISTGSGGDPSDAAVPALHAMATGCGNGGTEGAIPDDPDGACFDASLVGYPHFRKGSLPVIVLVTDAPFHNGPMEYEPYSPTDLGFTPPTYPEAVSALNEIGARIVAISVGGDVARGHLVRLVHDTDSTASFGPLLYSVEYDGDVSGMMEEGLFDIALLPLDVSAQAVDDDPGDGVDVMEAFIDHVEATGCTMADVETTDTNGDDRPDVYLNVDPGMDACFTVYPGRNLTVSAEGSPSVYSATLYIWGDNVTVLDHRTIYIFVPID